ncbi:FAST kinase domain-containing protein 4 [Prorops nasuta]|uniref:FAST kinase domain-containing protein 4 n=1 Tax=Prorops nasuta TaxID=863751 RepID=UPI0034CD215E
MLQLSGVLYSFPVRSTRSFRRATGLIANFSSTWNTIANSNLDEISKEKDKSVNPTSQHKTKSSNNISELFEEDKNVIYAEKKPINIKIKLPNEPNISKNKLDVFIEKENASDAILKFDFDASFEILKSVLCTNAAIINDTNLVSKIKSVITINELSEICESTNHNPKHINKVKEIIKIYERILPEKNSSFIKNYKGYQNAIQTFLGLSIRKERTEPLLKSLGTYIVNNPEILNIKQASDLLYCLATLNYPEQLLLNKIVLSLLLTVPNTANSSIIGSISTSLGLLKCKHTHLLDILCEWCLDEKHKCRIQDVCGLLHTLAIVGHDTPTSEIFIKKILYDKQMGDLSGAVEWLNFVWSLVILDKAKPEHISSILSTDSGFIQKMSELRGGIELPKKLKLLNINAVTHYVPGCEDLALPQESALFNTAIKLSKQQIAITNALAEALQYLMPSLSFYKVNVNLNMGFLVSATICTDPEGNFRPLQDSSEDTIRIAIMAHHYHTYCRIEEDVLGVWKFDLRLLRLNGYKIISLHYNHFNAKSTIIDRANFLKNCIVSSVKSDLSSLHCKNN